MDKILNFFQEILMIKKYDGIKVGLTQFKKEEVVPRRKDVSIRTKDEPFNFFELVLYMFWTTLIHICFYLKQIQICDEFLTGTKRE